MALYPCNNPQCPDKARSKSNRHRTPTCPYQRDVNKIGTDTTTGQLLGAPPRATQDAEDIAEFVEPTTTSIPGYMGALGWKGHKADEIDTYDVKEIAKHVRTDLKEAVAAGYLPDDLKYSVRSPSVSSIRLEVNDLPSDREVYDYTIEKGLSGHSARLNRTLKPEYVDLKSRVSGVLNAYNYNAGDAMRDYFDSGYYAFVDFPDEVDRALKATERTRNKVKRVQGQVQSGGATQEKLDVAREEQKAAYIDFIRAQATSDALYASVRETGVLDWDKVDERAERTVMARLKELDA